MKINNFSHINTFMGMDSSYDEADIVVYGVGFDNDKYKDVCVLHFDAHTDLREEYNNKNSHATVIKRVWDIVNKLNGKNIYLTIDLDVLDPSIFPGTGTPDPGGITYREFQDIFNILKNVNINIVGCDIVELSPDYDNTNVSTVTACKILRELALVIGYNLNK